MNEVIEPHGQEQTEKSEDIIKIGNDPVMQSALDVLSVLGNKGKVILKARGNSIPNAVAVANIITEKMLNGNSKVQKIILDTEAAAGIGSMTSTVEIILNKI
jgi:DNA-binding protein